MQGCGSSEVPHVFIRVKEEPAEHIPLPGAARGPGESTSRDSCPWKAGSWQGSYLIDTGSPVIEYLSAEAQVKVEQQNEQNLESQKENECVNEVKEELSCSDGVVCGVSEAAILAGLYTDHEVKDEVVFGLECPHRPDVNLVVRKGSRDKRLRNCCVRLEGLPSHDEHQTTTRNTTNHANLESDKEEIGCTVDCEKEPICDLCGKCFALKLDLVKHVMQHIHVPSTNDEGGQDVAVVADAFAGQCKQDLAQERALCRKYLVRDCCVRLERLHSDALLAGNQRATPATRTTIQGDTGSDTDDDTYHTVDFEKEPTCAICGQSFALKSDLKKHVMIHIHMPTAHEQSPAATIHSDRLSDTEEEIDISSDYEKEPVCDYCGANFALYSNLMKHVMMRSFGICPKRPPDTGEITMYVCDTCGKVYQQKYYLQLHIQNKHMPMTHKPYSCDACGQRFMIENSLKRHLRTHTAEKLYSCNLCQRQFTTLPTLKRHTRVHTGAKLYSCKVCNKSLAYKHTLVVHLRSHTGERPYSCTTCSKQFAQSSDLIKHRLIHTGEKPYSCTICNKKFNQSSSLKTHKLIHTRGKSYSCTICSRQFAQSSDLIKHRLIHTGEKPYSCTICNKKFNQSSSLKTHKLIHTGGKSYSCTNCSRQFAQSSDLIKHRLIHTGEKPYTCTICNKKFNQSSSLKTQKLIHTGGKSYSCTICSKRFVRSRDLVIHELTHTEERPYSCTQCNKRFKTSISSKKHKNIHTTELAFSCTICNKRFIRSSYLKRHIVIHTGEKPYACTICSKRFARSTDLVRHRFTHTQEQPFSCDTCGKKFKTTNGLKKHIIVHTDEELYSCEICNEQYSDTCQLNRHKETHVGYSFETICKIERL